MRRHGDGHLSGRERGLVGARMAEDGHRETPLSQALDLDRSIAQGDFRPDVVDVERPTDRLTRFAAVAGNEHGLDLRVEQMLDRRTSARTKPVLQAEHADELGRERHEKHFAAVGFDLGDLLLGDRDRDLLFQHERAAADGERLPRRRNRQNAETGLHARAAYRIRANAPCARGPLDGHRDRMRARAFRAGDEGEDLFFAHLADGLEVGHLRLAEKKRSASAERGDRDLAGFVPVGGAPVGDAATQTFEDSASHVNGRHRSDRGGRDRRPRGDGREGDVGRRFPVGDPRETAEKQTQEPTATR